MHIILLETGLWGNDTALDEALQILASAHRISRYDLHSAALTDKHCDAVVAAVLAGDTVMTV
ncbi:MAG: hypothetical protein M0Z76_09350 [Gammaproteobacteria bacterium]|nr:hypothetical protein [Gammaproteobacteria bacterium]